jgi:formate transporter
MADRESSPLRIDALLPPEMAAKAESAGVTKAAMGWRNTLVLGVLAGAFIALGAIFSTFAATGLTGRVPWGLVGLVRGLAFCLGLILVVVGGAELFTGNNLIVMAWANRRISTWRVVRNWGLVYVGNFVGAAATAGLMFLAGIHLFGGGQVGLEILSIAQAKCGLGFGRAFFLGIACNALVCLAIWLCYSARSTTDKILSIIFPITAFVAAGFEHSVANMYFMPLALLVKAGAGSGFWAAVHQTPMPAADVTWLRFLGGNLLPVTLGNIVGGSVLVSLVYWFVYVRKGLVPRPD